MTDDRNLSTEHQRTGDAKRPSVTLDKDMDSFDAKGRGDYAGFDRQSGEVHGSGSGAGGSGNPAEDYDSDGKGGGGTKPVEGPRAEGEKMPHPVDRDLGGE